MISVKNRERKIIQIAILVTALDAISFGTVTTSLIFLVLSFSKTGSELLYALVTMSVVSAIVSPLYGYLMNSFNPMKLVLFSLLGTGLSMFAIGCFSRGLISTIICVATIPMSGSTSLLTRLLISNLPASERPQQFASLEFARLSTQLFTPAVAGALAAVFPRLPFYMMGAINMAVLSIILYVFGYKYGNKKQGDCMSPSTQQSNICSQVLTKDNTLSLVFAYWSFSSFANLELPFFPITLPILLAVTYRYPVWKFALFNSYVVCFNLAVNRFFYSPKKRMLRALGVKYGLIITMFAYIFPGFALALSDLDQHGVWGEHLLWLLVPCKYAAFQAMLPLALTLLTSSIPKHLQGLVMSLNTSFMLLTLPVGNVLCMFLFTTVQTSVYAFGSGLLTCSFLFLILMIKKTPFQEDPQNALIVRRFFSKSVLVVS